MSTLQELIAKKEELERQIEQSMKQGRSDAIEKVRSLMSEYGLTPADVGGKSGPKPSASKGNKVAAKYRNTATGDSWSGRGLQPKWLKAALASGKKIEDFSV